MNDNVTISTFQLFKMFPDNESAPFSRTNQPRERRRRKSASAHGGSLKGSHLYSSPKKLLEQYEHVR